MDGKYRRNPAVMPASFYPTLASLGWGTRHGAWEVNTKLRIIGNNDVARLISVR
jgi:hypothetical protein